MPSSNDFPRVPHGPTCICRSCQAARRRAEREATKIVLVDATEAGEHVAALVAAGLSQSEIARRAGLAKSVITPALAEALWQRRRRTSFSGDDERVFCHPERGTIYREHLWAETFRAALTEAGITDYVRPFHDLRHTSLTHEAASGSSPIALMAKAGHTDMKVTQQYLHLAGIVFRDEAAALERRLGLGDENLVPNLVPISENLSASRTT